VSNIRYLSAEWIAAMSDAVRSNTSLQALAGDHVIGFTQVVTSTPHGDVTYHLQVGGGSLTFGAGEASPEHVRFTESWDTAVAVATGTVNAQEAFIKGAVKFSGNHQLLIDAAELFAELNGVFEQVRARTDYR
jgi:putative sterol carrier protein